MNCPEEHQKSSARPAPLEQSMELEQPVDSKSNRLPLSLRPAPSAPLYPI
jgi:hypothetical protein